MIAVALKGGLLAALSSVRLASRRGMDKVYVGTKRKRGSGNKKKLRNMLIDVGENTRAGDYIRVYNNNKTKTAEEAEH